MKFFLKNNLTVKRLVNKKYKSYTLKKEYEKTLSNLYGIILTPKDIEKLRKIELSSDIKDIEENINNFIKCANELENSITKIDNPFSDKYCNLFDNFLSFSLKFIFSIHPEYFEICDD